MTRFGPGPWAVGIGWRGARALTVAALAALALTAGEAAGQGARRPCEVVIDRTGGEGRQIDRGGGIYHIFQGGGVWAHCRGQATRMYADSVAYYQDLGRLDMTGHVEFRDSTAELRSERASYYLSDERLDAFGNAKLANLETGSLLTGPNLTYRRKAAGVRDTAELTATRRPTIEYHVADTAGAEPYLIVGDRVRLRGNTNAWVAGRVTIDRSDFHAKADSAELDTGAGNGRLVGQAQVEGADSAGYTLTGRTIGFRLAEDALTWVQAEERAESVSSAWQVVADTIQFDLEHNRIQRGNAWGDSLKPRAVSSTNTITGDSLAIVAPDQQLSLVRAIGQARATARRDSLDEETDWVAGDTVIAHFDSTDTGARALVTLEAMGNAKTQYRVFEEDGITLAGISYSRGDRILARFRGEALDTVHVWGQMDGVFLEAAGTGPRRGGGS